MNILGISALDKESTATIVCDGAIVAAVSEERLTRVKQQAGFPTQAVTSVLRLSGVTAREIDLVAYPFFGVWHELRLAGWSSLKDVARCWPKLTRRGAAHTLRHYGALGKALAIGFARRFAACDRELDEGLGVLGVRDKLRRYDHQYCHAVSAYYTSGFDRALVVTLDWYGSGKAGAIYVGERGRLRLVGEIPFPNSVAVMYSGVTSALGFIPDRHEGKVVGLAAYGDPGRVLPAVMARFVERADGYEFLDPMDATTIRDLVARYGREDVSAGHQRALELVAVRTVVHYLRKFGLSSVAAAGGVFANVKMNERIAELPEVEALFVHPAMGDMGTGTGAALAAAVEAGELTQSTPLPSVFLGPAYDDHAIEAALRHAGLPFSRESDMAARVAQLIAEHSLVARFTGRMEYGPRALGHRSVLANASDAHVTETLNEKLRRNDFMPFAPATLDTAAAACYETIDKVRHAARFMTVCVRCTPYMERLSPAAVHVDHTARPQLVTPTSNPDLHAILSHVERLTGAPSVINTSFNIHEEPIVCSPEDAIRAFNVGHLDYLAIGDYLVGREEQRQGAAHAATAHTRR
jgi:carbamoyltransferase